MSSTFTIQGVKVYSGKFKIWKEPMLLLSADVLFVFVLAMVLSEY
jgi:hypothetical protein